MTLQEFVKTLQRLESGEEPLIPYNLHSGLRQLQQSTPDGHSSIHHDWGLPAWARFFSEVGAATYPDEIKSGI